MARRDSQFYEEVILENVAAIQSCQLGSQGAFFKDPLTRDAVIKRLVVIGEALSAVRDELEEEYPQLAWHRFIGLRHRIAHDYGDLDQDSIWKLLTDGSLDQLRKALQ